MSTDKKLAEVERAILDVLMNEQYATVPLIMTAISPVISRLLDAARTDAGWKCFFCDEIFTDRHEAYLHFGEKNCSSDVPACVDPLRADEKARMNQVRQFTEDAQKARQELAEMEDAKENYESVWSEIRRYFGDDCNSVWLAGDRYKSALNAVEAARNAAHADALRAAAALILGAARDVQGNLAPWNNAERMAARILALTPERARLERELEFEKAIYLGMLHPTEAAKQLKKVADLEAKLGVMRSENKT